tara:strand:+ start:525 stop:776 length:252 start_codon:yes stop_codon:yes gene_type:complete
VKGKLYNTLEELEEQMFFLSHHFGLCYGERRGCADWCERWQVRADHPEYAGKWILTVPDDGCFKCDHLVDGITDFDEDWLPSG